VHLNIAVCDPRARIFSVWIIIFGDLRKAGNIILHLFVLWVHLDTRG
jgi:hypothetical protein